jgi:hypothetical protein
MSLLGFGYRPVMALIIIDLNHMPMEINIKPVIADLS